MTPLNITVVSDGRPGHYNQATGLVGLLEPHFKLQVSWLELRLRAKPLRPLLQFALNRRWWRLSRYFLYLLHGSDPDKLTLASETLLVAAGGNTRYLLAYLSQTRELKSCYLGSLRGLDPLLLGRVMTLEALHVPNNIVLPVAPVAIQRDEIERQGRRLLDEQPDNTPLYALIIGGDGAGCEYTENDWQQLATGMASLARRHGCRWLVSTSPRTGAENEAVLEAQIDPGILAASTWYSRQPEAVIPAYLGAANQVFVTADSMTMITEAVLSEVPVHVVAPRHAHHDARFAAALRRLEQRGLINRVALARLVASDPVAQAPDVTQLFAPVVDELVRYLQAAGVK